MSFVGQVIVYVYNPWTGTMIAGAEVSIFGPCEPSILGVTNSYGVFSTFMNPCPSVSFIVSKAGYREAYLTQGVGGDLTEVNIALIPSSGTPPVEPPVVTDLAVHVAASGGGNIAGAVVTVGGVSLVTNSVGIALYQGLALAVYGFTVEAAGYNTQTGTVDTSQIVDLYVTLTPVSEPPPPPIVEVQVTARVRYPDGSAAPDVSVRLVNTGGGYDVTKATGTTGYVTFKQVPVGAYMIYAAEGAWSLAVTTGMGTVELQVVVPEPPPPSEIPVTWVTNPPIASGTYRWSLTFQVVPIPFVSSWIAELMAGVMDDQTRLNTVLASAGVSGTAEVLDKQVTYKTNFYGAVYEFTIQYVVKLNVTGAASLIAWMVLLPFIPAILGILTVIVVGIVVLSILSKIEDITEGPVSPNLALIVVGALGVAYLSRGK